MKVGNTNFFDGYKKFPILGGRLLKSVLVDGEPLYKRVSNPWREAIEGRFYMIVARKGTRFQSLEGGYFILPFRGVRL